MSHRPFKQALYSQFARIGGALASERRLEVLDLLAQGPRHVEALAAETEMSVANVSQHLQTLRQARLVEAERAGNRVVYRLADDSVLRLWLALRETGESRLAEVAALRQQFGLDGDAGESIAWPELEALSREGKILLLDVRPRDEYGHGHLPGATSIPSDELEAHLGELPRDRRIVTYCRGRYCLFADEAVDVLRRHGFDAVRLDEGWIEWRAGEGAERADSSRAQ
jgi:rhodanese-related sulfurtransferase/DNA-binding transcriptional ArsR family regulator